MLIPSNCLLAALCAKTLSPRRVTITSIRNRAVRIHFMWKRDGQTFEFYTPGASRCSYLRNALRLGRVRLVAAASQLQKGQAQ